MAEDMLSLIKISKTLTLKEKDNGWAPDKNNLNVLEARGYFLGQTIGEGKHSKVKKALCSRTKEIVAIKIIYKARIHPTDCQKFVTRELDLLRTLQHPGLLDIIQLFECDQMYYIVMQYAPNGDLTEYINKSGSLSEADSRRLFKQLLDVVSYLHENNICHRDIKCDNILLDENYNLKLADFGFARSIPSQGLLETNCGSYVYSAPEVLDGEEYNGIAADVWSLGVCLYCMLCGKLPYRDEDIDILRCSMAEKLKFFKYVSKDCRALLRELLNQNPDMRPSVSTIIKHAWMCKPMKTGPGSSMLSSMAIERCTEDRIEIDPTVEHGFNCDQHSIPPKTTRVQDVLRSVAEVHTTGRSSVDLTKVPQVKKNSAAALTGVTGIVGEKLSQQLLNVSNAIASDNEQKIPEPAVKARENKFSKAAKTLNKFKHAAKVVTVVQRFRRGPLNSILNMPQEQAMQVIVDKQKEKIERDIKAVRKSLSAKVAEQCQKEKQEKYESKMKPIREGIEKDKIEAEKKELLCATICYLMPPTQEHQDILSTKELPNDSSTDEKQVLDTETHQNILETN